MKYSIKITHIDPSFATPRISYLSHNMRVSWCKKTAQKHLEDYRKTIANNPITAELEED